MTYQEIITRASLAAHAIKPEESLDRLILTAQTLFPSVVEELATAVAMNLQHPWRPIIADVTALLVSGAQIDFIGASTRKIIGLYGVVKDVSNGKALSNNFTLEEIRAINNNPNSMYKIPIYGFVIIKPRIYHTRPTVTIDVCVYDEVNTRDAIAANQVPLFPDAEGAYVSALVAKLTKPGIGFDADLQGQLMMIGQGK